MTLAVSLPEFDADEFDASVDPPQATRLDTASENDGSAIRFMR